VNRISIEIPNPLGVELHELGVESKDVAEARVAGTGVVRLPSSPPVERNRTQT
jgi:hypothetical protein